MSEEKIPDEVEVGSRMNSFALSPMESLFCDIDARFDGAGRVALLLRLEGCVEGARLALALARLQARHPKLRSRIVIGPRGRRHYEPEASNVPIPYEIRDTQSDDFPRQEETFRLLSTPFGREGHPLAAVTVVRNRERSMSDVIFAAHHAIADGLSMIAIVDEILTTYALAEQDAALESVTPLPLVSPRRATSSSSLRQRLRLIISTNRIRRENRRCNWASLPEPKEPTQLSLWENWVLTEQETFALAKRCRQERVSLNAALLGCGLCALAAGLTSNEARFKCRIPVDIRAHLRGPEGPVTEHDLGAFVGGFLQFYSVRQPCTAWALAKRVHADVNDFNSLGGPAFTYNLASVVSRWSPVMRSKQGCTKRGSVFVTNYGVSRIQDRYGSLRPQQCTLVFKADSGGPHLMMESIIVRRRLNLGLSTYDLDTDFAQDLLMEIRRQLGIMVG